MFFFSFFVSLFLLWCCNARAAALSCFFLFVLPAVVVDVQISIGCCDDVKNKTRRLVASLIALKFVLCTACANLASATATFPSSDFNGCRHVSHTMSVHTHTTSTRLLQ